ncbi:MAG: hypothetical protein MZV64_13530 [Ignavibacteriales bacterium]|nr:hypothetical protein [Ignavibacteriales bacterium]
MPRRRRPTVEYRVIGAYRGAAVRRHGRRPAGGRRVRAGQPHELQLPHPSPPG